MINDDAGLFSPPVSDHTLTVNYQYADGTQAAPSVTQALVAGAAYNISSPAVIGHTPDLAAVTGTMPGEDLTLTVSYTKNQHTLHISYPDEDGTDAAPPVSRMLSYGEAYSIPSPAVPGFTAEKPVVSGVMPDGDVSITVSYTKNRHTLTVRYLHQDGTPATQPHTQTIPFGEPYSVASPPVAGYLPDKPTVSGVMPDSDLTVDVTYSERLATLTVNYVYEDGTQAAPSFTQSYAEGAAYSIPSPQISGCLSDLLTVSGTMSDQDVTVTVTYRKWLYTLKVSYLYDNGAKASDPVTKLLQVGDSYSVPSPAISGYTANPAAVSGTMPKNDLSVSVTYYRTGGGSSGGSSGGGKPGITNPFDKPSGSMGGDFSNPFEKPSGGSSGGSGVTNPFEKPSGSSGGSGFTNPFLKPSGGSSGSSNPFEKPSGGSSAGSGFSNPFAKPSRPSVLFSSPFDRPLESVWKSVFDRIPALE